MKGAIDRFARTSGSLVVLALGWVLKASALALAAVPDARLAGRHDSVPAACASLETCLAALKNLPS